MKAYNYQRRKLNPQSIIIISNEFRIVEFSNRIKQSDDFCGPMRRRSRDSRGSQRLHEIPASRVRPNQTHFGSRLARLKATGSELHQSQLKKKKSFHVIRLPRCRLRQRNQAADEHAKHERTRADCSRFRRVRPCCKKAHRPLKFNL